MKYTNEIIINLPRPRVIALFEDPANMKHWQPGFQSMEHISGTPGQEGAKSRLKYKMGSREIEMIETITRNNLPDSFDGIYEAKGVHNLMFNRFIPLSENQTKWISDTEFEFSGFMKLMGWLMPGVFKKQSQQYLDKFKAFAESQK
ncbi:SRPBCC family protein [Adhaeribacter sp. BT258]|uniref:SRPBCC family protein n=1 Tax=Adhaeribacter terrigena TaxID=2793070 RepID=A0ABS1BZC9_9BACT|nr:SRPBCC family protein [Adhaeribacter terrigena]MBK0402465.1 SRPBCC family protein [Adhaeribacter terrigena]